MANLKLNLLQLHDKELYYHLDSSNDGYQRWKTIETNNHKIKAVEFVVQLIQLTIDSSIDSTIKYSFIIIHRLSIPISYWSILKLFYFLRVRIALSILVNLVKSSLKW